MLQLGNGANMIKIAVALLLLAGIVLYSMTSTPANPPVHAGQTFDAMLRPPAAVARIVDHSCSDCHSNNTHWPWYSRLPLAGSKMRSDVAKARSAFNLSDWSATVNGNSAASGALLLGMCSAVEAGRMPHPDYLMLHPEARLSRLEIKTFCGWTAAQARELFHQSVAAH
jgi:hypothetical protein